MIVSRSSPSFLKQECQDPVQCMDRKNRARTRKSIFRNHMFCPSYVTKQNLRLERAQSVRHALLPVRCCSLIGRLLLALSVVQPACKKARWSALEPHCCFWTAGIGLWPITRPVTGCAYAQDGSRRRAGGQLD